MYEDHFGLSRRPFSAVPQSEEYFPGAAIEAARQTLVRCVERGEGAAMVIGPAGTGKTLLCQMLAAQFNREFRVVLLARGRLATRRALLQAILYELGQPYRGLDEGELRLALIDYLTVSDECPQGVLLLVDEAHTLPIRLLDEMRMLTNLAAGGQPRVRLVLAGSAAMEERLGSPKLESFSQRIVARCYLESFHRMETEEYIHARLRAAGGQAAGIFPSEACEAVHRATDGVPRLVNQVCDHAMLLAYAAGRRQINGACVEEAWADLQQLPTPWNGEKTPGPAAESVIEFGNLDGDGDADEAPSPSPPSTVPMLRVTPDDDPSATPIEQLRRIEDTLGQLEEEFQPAGSIGPEVELVFADPSNPFSEHFAQEEVIVERYASPVTQALPAIEFAAELACVPQPQRAVEPAPQAETQDEPQAAPQPETQDDTQEVELANESPHFEMAGVWARADAEAQPGTVPIRQAVEPAAAADDSDLIVIEEGYDDAPSPPPIRPVTPVRQHEYRRLFARLRRG